MTFDEAIEHVEDYGLLKEESDIMFEKLREKYAKPVKMNLMQSGLFMAGKNADNSFYDTVYEVGYEDSDDYDMIWIEKKSLYSSLSEDDLMYAWLHPEVIKVVY